MRQQSEQVARAMAEQSQTTNDLTKATTNISRQIALIARANIEHSNGIDANLVALTDIRKITDRSARDAEDLLVGIQDWQGED